jgi:hypothetical protein
MKTKILITVEGCIIQNISANADIEIVIVDYDNWKDDEQIVSEILSPDTQIKEDEKFHEHLFGADKDLSASRVRAKDRLTDLDY